VPSTVIHAMDAPWSSSSAALSVTVEPIGATGSGPSNRMSAPLGAVGATATFTPAAPLDLSAFDEVRFWVNADRPADGTAGAPFWLELSYRDVGDLPGEEHRWFVSVNAEGAWEQRRIGIGADRRTAVDRFRFTAIDDRSFSISVDELLAVDERMLQDLEAALVGHVGDSLSAPGLTDIALAQTASLGDATISVPAAAPFAAGNRILLTGGVGADELHDVTLVTPGGVGENDLQLADTVGATFNAGVGLVTVLVPVVVEAPPTPTPHPTPAVVITPLGLTEDPERARYHQQRDSFRPRAALVACSVRPAPRAYLADYQVAVVAQDRAQQAAIVEKIQTRLSTDVPLHVNGASWPVWIVPALPLLNREFGTLAPSIYLRVGARAEIALRVEIPWVQRVHVGAGRPDTPADTEAIVIQL
jgi:hypothetical protein